MADHLPFDMPAAWDNPLTRDRWGYLFEAELNASRRAARTVDDTMAEVESHTAELLQSLVVEPNAMTTLRAAVRVAVMAYRLAAEGCPEYGRAPCDYKQYEEFPTK